MDIATRNRNGDVWPMKTTIIGAAGAIGRTLTQTLLAQGHAVQLVGRDKSKLERLGLPGATLLSADVATAEGCRAALTGMDAGVYTLGLPYTKKDFAQYPAMMTA